MDEAKANGTYFKAPNGKASNLNERQWIQFGDNKGRISRKCPFNGKCTDQSKGKGAKFSLQGGRAIADEYEKKVNTKGKGEAMHLSKFNFMEVWQDEMRALKEVQRIIEQEYGIVLESYEDAYMAENAMSSIAKNIVGQIHQ